MKKEDLFLAIGEVEESRLARSELSVSSDAAHWEETHMSNYKKRGKGRFLRGLLIAAVVVTMLATTAFAYAGFAVYENPRAMLEAFFGEQPEPHGADCGCAACRATAPTYERGALDEDVAMADVAPYISAVGDSFVYEPTGLKFTVDAHLFDDTVDCGLVYYTVERTGNRAQYPIDYNLEASGEIWGIGECLTIPSRMYLVQEESTPCKLKIAAYYIRPADAAENYLEFSFGSGEDEHVLYLPYESGSEMKSITLAEGSIVISPIGIVICGGMEGVPVSEGSNEVAINEVVIRYKDGTEYLVEKNADGNDTQNYAYALMDTTLGNITYALNRVVDVENVACVIVNGTEFAVE